MAAAGRRAARSLPSGEDGIGQRKGKWFIVDSCAGHVDDEQLVEVCQKHISSPQRGGGGGRLAAFPVG